MALEGILSEVAAERAKQDKKWGEQNHEDGTDWFVPDVMLKRFGYTRPAKTKLEIQKTVKQVFEERQGDWSWILLEEFLEVLTEPDQEQLRQELIQVAAVAVAWVECIDRNGGN